MYAGFVTVSAADGSQSSLALGAYLTSKYAVWCGSATIEDTPIEAYSAWSRDYVTVLTGSAAGTKVYQDGLSVFSTGNTPDSKANSRLTLYGTRTADPSYAAKVYSYLVAAWDRTLSASEVAELSANPWQLFQP